MTRNRVTPDPFARESDPVLESRNEKPRVHAAGLVKPARHASPRRIYGYAGGRRLGGGPEGAWSRT